MSIWKKIRTRLTPSNHLFAGPFVGEFGHELFCWQGILRHLSRTHDHTEIICRPGHAELYRDFADEIVEYEPQRYEPNGSYNLGVTKDYPTPPGRVRTYFGPNTELTTYWPAPKNAFSRPQPQEFIKYGTRLPKKQGYLYLIHARDTAKAPEYDSPVRNWDLDRWNTLVNERLLAQGSVASIGTKQAAAHIPNTVDLRGCSLEVLVHTMAASQYILATSSGPVHLGALCGMHVIVWSPRLNYARHTRDWNPHGCEVTFIETEEDWNPTVEQIVDRLPRGGGRSRTATDSEPGNAP